jgi:hypothetical protein
MPIEVKAAGTIGASDLRHLDTFCGHYADQAPFALILHDTDRARVVTRRIAALPVSRFL